MAQPVVVEHYSTFITTFKVSLLERGYFFDSSLHDAWVYDKFLLCYSMSDVLVAYCKEFPDAKFRNKHFSKVLEVCLTK